MAWRFAYPLWTFACFDESHVILGHIGDSRIYRLRKGRLRQLTSDHSLTAAQVKTGLLTAEEAEESPFQHVLTQTFGIKEDWTPDLITLPFKRGDLFLLCNADVNKSLSEEAMQDHLDGHPFADWTSLRNAARYMVQHASMECEDIRRFAGGAMLIQVDDMRSRFAE